MADLIAIGYDDEETAARAAEEVYRVAGDLLIEPEAVAVTVRDQNGKYKVTTNHHPVAEGATWGCCGVLCSGSCSSSPFSASRLGGAFGALFGAMQKAGIDQGLQEQVRDVVKPGTSALFLVVRKVTTDKLPKRWASTVARCSSLRFPGTPRNNSKRPLGAPEACRRRLAAAFA